MRTQTYPKCHQFKVQRGKKKTQTKLTRSGQVPLAALYPLTEQKSNLFKVIKLQLFLLNEPERTDGLFSYCHKGQNKPPLGLAGS